jgi:hypothetical protein
MCNDRTARLASYAETGGRNSLRVTTLASGVMKRHNERRHLLPFFIGVWPLKPLHANHLVVTQALRQSSCSSGQHVQSHDTAGARCLRDAPTPPQLHVSACGSQYEKRTGCPPRGEPEPAGLCSFLRRALRTPERSAAPGPRISAHLRIAKGRRSQYTFSSSMPA